ncbi:MAG TPA: U32 family peptidase [Syntrophomonas sp.]|nr:U32 family peptidase [Syntrophomonas sp.]HRW12337.1 U32 family peptidase [Syntrophomonas sp.]
MKQPELLLPAGDLDKLKTALHFGADAVYAGGKEYSLRAAAGNLNQAEMNAGLALLHAKGKKLYVTVNILAHNRDLKNLPAYLESLADMGVDGLIVADPGIMKMARTYAPRIPITVSTQANITNYEAAAVYKEWGASRLVLARELSLQEIRTIKAKVDVELEIFVHGAMCVSYSGRCLLSHYMTGRSANAGECAHPCRYQYRLVEEKRPEEYYPIEEDERGSYILNSRDLCLLPYIPQLVQAGIDSFKIEGRMKSALYVAVVAQVYRQALDACRQGAEQFSQAQLHSWMEELQRVATRPFTDGFIAGEVSALQDIAHISPQPRAEFCGIVRGYDQDRGRIIIEQRANFGPGEDLQLMSTDGQILDLVLEALYDQEGNPLDRARHAKQSVYLPFSREIEAGSILRRVAR